MQYCQRGCTGIWKIISKGAPCDIGLRYGEAVQSNAFLKRIIIEVLTDNYRQMLAEAVENTSDNILRLDPPLRANERGIAGLFASAVGHVSARYRTEARVDRPGLEEDEIENCSHAGRVDYLAWYERRVIGLELKVGSMNAETGALNEPLKKRWSEVTGQAQAVQKDLRDRHGDDKTHFPDPLSIALLVVIGRRKMTEEKISGINQNIQTIVSKAVKNLSTMETGSGRNRPKFVAVYTLPDQFRVFYPKRNGHADRSEGGAVVYTPFVAFLARPYVRVTPRRQR